MNIYLILIINELVHLILFKLENILADYLMNLRVNTLILHGIV
nr:hypothetical protein [Methanosphaera sp. BMS]